MQGKKVSITTWQHEEFSGYLVLPKEGKGVGIVLLHEIYGINNAMRETAERLAEEGFVVLIPDLFWRLKPGLELSYSDLDQAFECYHQFNTTQGLTDITDTISFLRRRPDCKAAVVSLGFSFGGKLSFLAATQQMVDAAICFYGNDIVADLTDAENISCPLQFHFGEEDEMIPSAQIEQIKNTFRDSSTVEVYVYFGAEHSFYNRWRNTYDVKAAELAHQRMLELLDSFKSSYLEKN